jgi:hypothetical protein
VPSTEIARVTIKCIAYALAAALLVSGAQTNAQKSDDIEDEELGLTHDDVQALLNRGGLPHLPPAEYDHPYQGKLEVVTGTQEQTRNVCGHPNEIFIGGCAVPNANGPNTCTIFRVRDEELKLMNWTANLVMRHEIGHCNGWPEDHRGAR